MTRLLLLALLGCSVAPVSQSVPDTAPAQSDEDRWFATQAAMLDPNCYHEAGTAAGTLDITVSDGHVWYATNMFAVYYNDPLDVSQDAFPGTRRSGFLRPLDARRSVPLSAGTRVRSNIGINVAYVFYCDPQTAWSFDTRYADNPRGLYYERLRRLSELPVHEVILEATGGGALSDDLHVDLPAAPILLTSASVYDASWMTIGCADGSVPPLNLLSEINNSHAVRFAESLLQPIGGCPLRVALQKGSNADSPGSTDPAIAYPIHGSGSLTYIELPTDW